MEAIKQWFKKQWVWVVISAFCILGIAITPADNVAIVPYVLIIFAMLYYWVAQNMKR